MLKICTAEFTDAMPGFARELSKGLDFFKDILDTEGELEEWKQNRIHDWLVTIIKDVDTTTVPSPPEKKQAEQEEPVIDREQFSVFLSDCEARLSRAQELILLLEEEPENLDYIKELFRIFHTIKGESGFLKLVSLGHLTHTMENLLDLLRSEKTSVDSTVINYLLSGLDLAKAMLTEIADASVVISNKVPFDSFINSLTQYTENVKQPIGTILVNEGLITEEEKKEILNAQANNGYTKKFGEVAVETKYITEESLQQTLKTQHNGHEIPLVQPEKNVVTPKIRQDKTDSIIKVRTSKVNYLVDMIGELLIALGQIHESVPGLSQVRKITKTLQYASMQLRTESVKMLFGNVRRIIRDTSNKLGKTVKTEFIGDDLEIDRLLIESLEEPLMHLVRNALDHGIESAEDRTTAGKSPEGTVRVSAERRGNNIVISVGDDGRGLDRDKILTKAIEKGLVTDEDAQKMTDAAAYNIIFLPGFSTKVKADLMSGRGVGMDIIKQVVTKFRGHVDIINHPGHGSTFELFFPLSTAIIDGMTVRTGSNIFIIPLPVIIESVKIDRSSVNKIREGVEILNLRGQIIPLIKLEAVFAIPDAGDGLMATIVENSNRERYAIVSDEILAKREIVIKSLGARFRNFRGISSGTVLAGGTIGLVLDIDEVIALGLTEDGGVSGADKTT
jgi:two-component system chemotaxis sensor kinase CheA